ncbi:excinuclease [Abyssibacter profundi]|uniref:Excinuclease n=1 Tax=Abyssibacter profundi TaxID=2182787 RepID=A0A363UJ84_9GAMM|nr:excinuclease [Abyssibacter profundi]PWN55489.1 excinuclease [Abyssibacter profundi]
MKQWIFALLLGLVAVAPAQARDDHKTYPLSDFFAREDVQNRLGNDVKFYFGDQAHPAIASRLGEYQSNKKTNAFNKTDQEACEWALLSAMLSLRDRAVGLGADAVVNITSNYRNTPFSSQSEYMCGAGNIIAGVTMKGEAVKFD